MSIIDKEKSHSTQEQIDFKAEGKPTQVQEEPNGRPSYPPRAAAISIDCGGGVGSGDTLDNSKSINQEFGKLGYGHQVQSVIRRSPKK